MVVSLIRERKIYRRVQPASSGLFEVPDVTSGVYSFVAAGPAGFMAFGVQVNVREDAAGEVQHGEVETVPIAFRPAATELDIDGVAVPPSNFNILKTLIRFHLGDYLASDPSVVPPRGDVEAPLPIGPTGGSDQEPVPRGSTIRKHAVRLAPDGGLRGRVRRVHPESGQPFRVRDMAIFVLQDDQIVAQAAIHQSGDFLVLGLQPGVYSLAALGTQGVAAFSFRLLPPQVRESAFGERPVALLSAAAMQEELPLDGLELDVALVSPLDIPAVLEAANRDLPGGLEPAAGAGSAAAGLSNGGASPSGRGSSSGAGGGGSGGGGGSPFAAMLSGMAAAAGATSFADSSNERPPASPFRP